VWLEAAGSISGRVFDERGEGVAGVEVELVTRRYVPGGTLAVGVGFAQTEALGVFRIDDVVTGDYYVRAYVSGRMPSGPADALPSTGDEERGSSQSTRCRRKTTLRSPSKASRSTPGSIPKSSSASGRQPRVSASAKGIAGC
jgi:hypothetical protein